MTTSEILKASVSPSEDVDGQFDFGCPVFKCEFTSKGWPTRAIAEARGAQHFSEHKGEGITPSLEEFRAEHGLSQDGTLPADAITVKDL